MTITQRLSSIFKAKKQTEKRGFWLNPWEYGQELVREEDMGSQVRAYRSWVYIAAQKNATAFTATPLRLYVSKQSTGQKLLARTKKVGDDRLEKLYSNAGLTPWIRKAAEVEEVIEHPFLDMMQNVNPFSNQHELMSDTCLFEDLTGNSYWYIVNNEMGVPGQVWIMPSQNMIIVPSKEEFIKGYIWRKGSEDVGFTPEEIIHFKLANPTSVYYGMSPLAAAKDSFNINASMNKYELSLFSNFAQMPGYFYSENPIGDSDFERIKKEVQDNWNNAKNTGKKPLLDSGLKYQEIGLPPRELNFLAGRKWTQEEIINIYGQSLALYDKNTTKANADAAMFLWMSYTIAPRHRLVEQKINEQLMPRYDENLFVAFDNCVPEDREFRLRERQVNIQIGYTTINEERAQDGLEPVAWGEEPAQQNPFGGFPVEESLKKKLLTVPSGATRRGMSTSRPSIR